nr:MAG TPA: hypothetical protein [Caudoviricetes sp.]
MTIIITCCKILNIMSFRHFRVIGSLSEVLVGVL